MAKGVDTAKLRYGLAGLSHQGKKASIFARENLISWKDIATTIIRQVIFNIILICLEIDIECLEFIKMSSIAMAINIKPTGWFIEISAVTNSQAANILQSPCLKSWEANNGVNDTAK